MKNYFRSCPFSMPRLYPADGIKYSKSSDNVWPTDSPFRHDGERRAARRTGRRGEDAKTGETEGDGRFNLVVNL